MLQSAPRSAIRTLLVVLTFGLSICLCATAGANFGNFYGAAIGFGAAAPGVSQVPLMGDVDADGKSDAVVYNATYGYWYVSLSDGQSFKPWSSWTSFQYGPTSSAQFLADINADSAADAVTYYPADGNWWVALSARGANNKFDHFAPYQRLTPASRFPNGFGKAAGGLTQIPLMGDVTGDGRIDALIYNASWGHWYVARSNGTDLDAFTQWNPVMYGPTSTAQFIADVTGDGAADAVTYYPSDGNWWFAPAVKNGGSPQFNGFGMYQRLTPSASFPGGFGKAVAGVTQIPLMGDLNGDGKSDAVIQNGNNGAWYAARSNGTEFVGIDNWHTHAFGQGSTTRFVTDVNNDQRADAIAYTAPGGTWTLAPGDEPEPASNGVPIGNLPGWNQLIAEEFTKPSTSADGMNWKSVNDPDKIVYTGDPAASGLQPVRWRTYPETWCDTVDNQAPCPGITRRPYRSGDVLSVSGGSLKYNLHPVAGRPAAANPSPVLFPGQDASSNQYQVYGKYSARMKFSRNDLPGYKVAFLLWPKYRPDLSPQQNDELWKEAESDYPEGAISGSGFSAFSHHAGGGQVEFPVAIDMTGWHVYTHLWNEIGRFYYLDGRLIGADRAQLYSHPERWQMQVETTGSAPLNYVETGTVEVDWVTVYGRP